MNKQLKDKLIQYSMIALGVILLDIGFYFFMNPANIILGGMMGLATLLESLYTKIGPWFTASIFLFIGNVITLIIGGILLGKDFFAKTVFSSLFSPVVVFIFEHAFDPLFFLKAVSSAGFYLVGLVCGSLLAGVGLGLAIKNNGCTGGMDVVQRIMSKYMKVPHSKTMYLTDWVIVLLAGFNLTGSFSYNIEVVIYGLVGVYVVGFLIDKMVIGTRSRRTAYIITDKPEEIRKTIYETINRGVTIVYAKGGYTGEDKSLLICTMETDEAYKITELLRKDYPDSFSFLTATTEIVGTYENRKII